MDLFILHSMLFFPVLGHRCHCCSDQGHLRVQPAGRGPRSLHQPNGLHLCRVPAGRGGGGTERRPTGLHPYWHEQTLWWAASCNKAVMWLAHGKDECVCVANSGEHPRTGALDVCPFIPVQNVSMDDCVNCANIFGKRLAEMLHIPGETRKFGWSV